MAEKAKKTAGKANTSYKIEGDKISASKQVCPKCGKGYFLAEHKNRLHCGKCGYTKWKQ